eukprot:GHVT01104541.1.p2 GENE.GHVT01104541.1~~GHVT01104541.1.p2  ORF type:complete len:117 (-),score=8.45 GHVT01104541.1:286-636(-)
MSTPTGLSGSCAIIGDIGSQSSSELSDDKFLGSLEWQTLEDGRCVAADAANNVYEQKNGPNGIITIEVIGTLDDDGILLEFGEAEEMQKLSPIKEELGNTCSQFKPQDITQESQYV